MRVRPRDFATKRQYLWVDLPEAEEMLGASSDLAEPALVGHFAKEGYAIKANAISEQDIVAFLAELQKRFEDPLADIRMTYLTAGGRRQEPASRMNLDKPRAKVLDVHAKLETSQRLVFAPPVVAFLRDVFRDDPVAFQSLYFEYGSQQPAHQDTAFVPVDPPFQLVASWIALEDVSLDSGELFFYPRSHAFGEVRFANGGKAMDPRDPEASAYSQFLEATARQNGLERRRFRPSRGDVLYWINDLIHGGEQIKHHVTRRSLVTHYCPLSASIPWARARGLQPRPTAHGGYILSGT